MKKFISLLLTLALLLAHATVCLSFAEDSAETFHVITTIFPLYDWVRQVAGGRADAFDLKMLLTTGVDLHNYQPSAEDVVAVSNCDMFIYVGGESDAWVADVLTTAQNDHMVSMNLLDVLGDTVKIEELVEGMEHDHEHEEEHDHDHDDHEHEEEHAHEGELDEHVWLSLKNAKLICREIASQLSVLDPDYADVYAANAEAYIAQLSELDDRYQAAVDAGTKKAVLFGDRFPFRYLADDYGLNYFAAFSGCSAASEASFETVIFLASKVDELGLSCVLTLEGPDHSIAETVISSCSNKEAQILEMNSMQSVTMDDVDAGMNYLDVMEKNLAILTQALS